MSARRRLLLHSVTQGIFEPKIRLLNGVASGTSEVLANGNAQRWIFTLQYDAGVSAGEVAAESLPSKTFTGTPANEGNSTASSGGFDRIVVDSSAEFMQLRITTPIVGGNVTAWAEVEGVI